MLFVQSRGYQEKTHANLEAALARGELFAIYLTTLPQKFTLNHAVLVFAKQKSDSSGRDNYLARNPLLRRFARVDENAIVTLIGP